MLSNGWLIGILFDVLIVALVISVLIYVMRRPCSRQNRCRICVVTGPTGHCPNNGAGMIHFSSNVTNISNGVLIGSGFITAACNEFAASVIMTTNVVLQNLFVNLTTIPGGGNSWIFIVRVNGVNTGLQLILSNFATSGTNTVDTVPVSAGARVSLQVTAVGMPLATLCEASVQYVAAP